MEWLRGNGFEVLTTERLGEGCLQLRLKRGYKDLTLLVALSGKESLEEDIEDLKRKLRLPASRRLKAGELRRLLERAKEEQLSQAFRGLSVALKRLEGEV